MCYGYDYRFVYEGIVCAQVGRKEYCALECKEVHYFYVCLATPLEKEDWISLRSSLRAGKTKGSLDLNMLFLLAKY